MTRPPRRFERSRPLLVMALIAAVLLAFGRPVGALLLVIAGVGVSQALVIVPDRVARVESAVGRGAARAVAAILLTPVQVLLVFPAGAIARVLGSDPLDRFGRSGRWNQVPADTPAAPARPYTDERALRGGAGAPAWRLAAAMLAVGVLAGLLLPRVLDRDEAVVPTALADGDGYNAMASAALVDEPWAEQAGTEFFDAVATGQTYTPYIGYSLRDFDGTHVNIVDRQRVSYQPVGDGGTEPTVVWFMGGSAMFGFSAQRDDHTIPSEVARLAETDGRELAVHNYGAPGYVNFQETVLLTQLLLAGGRPDVVVFYDGINDLALQLHRTYAFGEAGELGDLSTQGYRSYLAGALTGTAEPPSPLLPPFDMGDPEAALDGLARTLDQGIELSQTLADRYGFTVVHAWQPDLFSKAELDPGEAVNLEPLGYDEFRFDALVRVSGEARGQLPDSVIDLGGVLDDLEGPVLSDQVHTNEAGALAVAEALYPAIMAALDRGEEAP